MSTLGGVGAGQGSTITRTKVEYDFKLGIAPNGLTHALTSEQSYWDAGRVLKWAAAGEFPCSHNPVTGEAQGLPMFVGTTNLLYGVSWSGTGTEEANSAVGVEGLQNVSKITLDTGQQWDSASADVTASGTGDISFSVFLPKDSITVGAQRSIIRMTLTGGTTNYVEVYFNSYTGVMTENIVAASVGSRVMPATAENYGDNWRVWFTVTSQNNTAAFIRYKKEVGTFDVMYPDFPQLEINRSPTMPARGTRSEFTLKNPAFSAYRSGGDGTVITTCSLPNETIESWDGRGSVTVDLFELSDGTGDNSIRAPARPDLPTEELRFKITDVTDGQGSTTNMVPPVGDLTWVNNENRTFYCNWSNTVARYYVDDNLLAIKRKNQPTVITGASIASPTVITAAGHGYSTGAVADHYGDTTATPTINGTYQIASATTDTYTIPVNVTVAGTDGWSQTHDIAVPDITGELDFGHNKNDAQPWNGFISSWTYWDYSKANVTRAETMVGSAWLRMHASGGWETSEAAYLEDPTRFGVVHPVNGGNLQDDGTWLIDAGRLLNFGADLPGLATANNQLYIPSIQQESEAMMLTFLANPLLFNTAANNLITNMDTNHSTWDGVICNFEAGLLTDNDNYQDFLRVLKAKVHAEGKLFYCFARGRDDRDVDFGDAYAQNIPILAEIADMLCVGLSNYDEPDPRILAPEYWLSDCLDFFISQGAQPSKMCFTMSGYSWETTGSFTHIPYADAIALATGPIEKEISNANGIVNVNRAETTLGHVYLNDADLARRDLAVAKRYGLAQFSVFTISNLPDGQLDVWDEI